MITSMPDPIRRDRRYPGNRRKAGFSLGEVMVALLIVSLLSMSIATGVAFGMRQYNKAVANSEARILCSTLTSVITDELSNARNFDSNNTLKAKDGQIYKGDGSPLLPAAAYSGGTHELSATIENLKFENGKYTVKLSVSPINTDWKVETTFDVLPLNSVNVKSS